MKCLLLAALFCLAAANKCRDEERIYKYETQVASGLIPNSPLRSGIKLSAHARMHFKCQSTEVRVQLINVVLYKIDQPLVQIKTESRTIPNEFLKEWVGADQAKIVEAIQIPFAFQYTKAGQVTDLAFDDNDMTINIKKGLISLFEVNLEKRLMLGDDSFRSDPIRSKTIEPEHTTKYTVFERSTTGDCATQYFVHPMTIDSKHVMTVDKVRDYSRCFNAPGYRKSQFFEGIEMPESFKANPLTHTSNIRYSITGILKNFVITSAIVEERIIFAPYYTPKETEEVRTTVNQTLVLYESKRLSEASPIAEVKMSPPHKAYHKANHLMMTIPNSDVKPQVQVPDIIKQGMSALTYPVDKIIAQLQHVAKNVQEITSKESLVHMRVAIEMLRSSPYADIKKAFVMLTSTNTQTPINKFAVEILWTALNHVGTDAAAHFLLDTCTTDATLIHNCSWTLTQLTLTATPTPDIINKITKMLKSTVAETPFMKMKLYLTLGSFAYKMNSFNARKLKELEMAEAVLTPLTKESQKNARDVITMKLKVISQQKISIHTVTKETSEKIMKILTDLLEKSDVKDKILALKAIRNSGLPAAVTVLKKFLVDDNIKKAMPYVRVLAILAHSRFVDHPTARVESISFLVDLLMHTTEANEIRTAAFHVLMSLKPDLPLLEMIAVKMQSEKDLQLTSYVLSFLQSYANSTFTPVMSFSKNATVALKSAPEYATGVDHAFYKFGGYYNEKFRMGSSFKLASHGSMDRFMSWDFALDTVLFGKSTTPFSMNVATQGMTSLINNLFGAKGVKSLSTNLISSLLRTNSGSINPKQFIEDIISGINMKPRALESFQAQAQLNMFGHEVRYFDSIADLLQFFIPGDKLQFSMVKDTIQASLPLNIATTMYLMDAKVSMPTESGFPVSLQTQITSSMKVTGDVKVDAVMPTEVKESKTLNLPQMLPKNVDLDVNINKKCVLGLYASMGLDTFFVKPTVGFHGLIKVVAPIKVKTTVNLATGIVEEEFRLPQQDAPIVETVFEPVSEFLTISNITDGPTVKYIARPIYASVNERITPIAITLPIPFLGHELKVIGQSPVGSFYPIPASPLRGLSEMKLSLVPGANAPSVVTIKSKWMCMWNAKTSEALKASTVDVSPITKDPINLSEVTKLTMPMVMKKLMTVGKKVVPTAVNPWDMAFVVTVDASSSGVVRQMQAEYFTHQTDSVNHQHFRMLRLWTSAIPGWTDKALQLIGEFDVTSPTKVYTPENVYSIQWHKQLLRDLEYYINSPIESSKVMNAMMNMTLTSISEQLYQPNMDYVPASRVLDSLMPEIYYSKIMMTPAVPEKTLLVLSKVQEELQVIVDPSFRIRNVIVMELFDQLIESQQTKINNLEQILANLQQTNMTELAYTQWMVMKNADTLVMLKEIVAKYQATGAITNVDEIKPKMVKSSKLMVTILKKIENILLNKKLSYTVAKPGVADLEVKVTEPLKDMSNIHSIEDLKVSGVPTENNVVTGIQVVCLKQIQEMISILEKLNKAQKLDVSSMQGLMHESQKALAFYDRHIKSKFLTAQPIPNFLILTTVQNEFLVKLWQSYMNMQVISATIVTAEDKKSIVDIGLMTKSVSFRLAMRVSQWVKAHKLALIMGDQEDETVRKMRESLWMVQRNVMIESQDFTYIQAGHKDANNVLEIANKIVKTIDDSILIINETVEAMHQLPNRPSVYLTSAVLETVGSLSRFTSMFRQYLYPVCSTLSCRLMITKMETHITQLSQLVDILSPIYEKYNTASLIMATNTFWHHLPESARHMTPNRPHIPSMNLLTSQTDDIEAIKAKLTEHQNTFSNMLKSFLSGKLISTPVESREVAVTDFKSRVNNFIDYLYQTCFSHPWTYLTSAEFKFGGDVAIIELITNIIDSQVKSIDTIVGLMKTKPELFEGVSVTSADLVGLKKKIVSIKQSIVGKDALKSAVVKDELTKRQMTFSRLSKYFLSGKLIGEPVDNRVEIVTTYESQVKNVIKYVREECFTNPWVFGSPEFKFRGDVSIIKLITSIFENQVKSIDYIVKTLKTNPELFKGLSVTYGDFNQIKVEITKITQSIVGKGAMKGLMYIPGSAGGAAQIPTGVTGRLSISWGDKNTMDKNILLEVFAGRSLEQIMWLVKQLNPSVMSPELVTALTARMSGQVSVKEGFMDVFNTYNHIQMVANFKSEQLPQWVKNWAVAAQESLKFNLWNFYSRHSRPASVVVAADQIVSTIDLSGLNNKVDFTVMTNTESDVFVNVPLIPTIYKSLKPTQSLRPVSQQFVEYVSGGFSPATCTVHADQVNTWDTVRYTLPQTVTPCRTVLAMDCSADPTFAITMVPSAPGAPRTLEIVSLNKLIKLTPVVTSGQISAEIKVNDEVVTLEQDVPVIVQGVILRKGGRHVEVIMPKTGVIVALEGVVVKIQVPKLFQHRMCGLCSNFDSQKSWEFEGPQQEVYMSQKDFALSYIVPNNVCPATMKPTINLHRASHMPNPNVNIAAFADIDWNDVNIAEFADIDWNDKMETAICKEEQRVQVKQFRKNNLICFSTVPVTECSFDCDHERTEVTRTMVAYKCVERTAHAQNLMRLVRKENYMVTASDLNSIVTVITRKATMEYNCAA